MRFIEDTENLKVY